MADVNGGKISYGRVRKDDDFGINRKMDCELTFTIGENDILQDCLKKVADTAVELVHKTLGLTASTRAAPIVEATGTVAAQSDKDKLAAAITKPEPEKKTRAKKPPTPAADELEDPLAESQPAASTAKPSTGAADELDEFAPLVEITDADIQDKVTKKNAAIKNPLAIRGLIGKYVSPPKSMRDIPKEVRAKFLEELEALKPAA